MHWPKAGETPEITVAAGTHAIEVKKDGFHAYSSSVTIEAGALRPLRVRLDAIPRSRPNRNSTASIEISPATGAIATALQQPVSLKFPKDTPLEDVLRYVTQATRKGEKDPGIPIYVDPVGLLEAGRSLYSIVSIDVAGIPLTVTLPRILDQIDLGYIVKDDVVIISSPEAIERESNESPVIAGDRKKATMEVLAKLDARIPMHFATETALDDVLNHVKQTTKRSEADPGVPIYVKPTGLREAERAMTSTIRIDLEGVPLKTSLRLLLKQLDLAYLVKDGMLVISSIEDIKQELARPASDRKDAPGPEEKGVFMPGESDRDRADGNS